MMAELEKLLQEQEIPFNAIDRKIMCYAHVINLSAGRIISGYNKPDDQDNDWETESINTDDDDDLPEQMDATTPNANQTYEEAITRDPLKRARAIVRIIRASGKRRDAFNDVIATGNEKGYWGGYVKPQQLVRDVTTRWDSVFYMLRRLRELKLVRSFPLLHFCLLIGWFDSRLTIF
jgi:hypothetical protein